MTDLRSNRRILVIFYHFLAVLCCVGTLRAMKWSTTSREVNDRGAVLVKACGEAVVGRQGGDRDGRRSRRREGRGFGPRRGGGGGDAHGPHPEQAGGGWRRD